MKLWRENKVSEEYEMSEDDIAQAWFTSEYASIEWPIERSLRVFMSSVDGLDSVWEDTDAFLRVLSKCIDLRFNKKQSGDVA